MSIFKKASVLPIAKTAVSQGLFGFIGDKDTPPELNRLNFLKHLAETQAEEYKDSDNPIYQGAYIAYAHMAKEIAGLID